ncbi:morphogenic membrane protein MmpB [Streptomyces sp. 7-21]|jgi:hypothetical protein|nr:hypothetical protein [Streptomyces sp. 7-21]
MLWSDLRREPDDVPRATARKLRRASWVLAAAMVAAALLVLWR